MACTSQGREPRLGGALPPGPGRCHMNVLDLLERDHHRISHLLREIEHAPHEQRQQELTLELGRELEAHARLEQELFYPALGGVPALRALVQESEDEHHRVREQFETLAERGTGTTQWLVQFGRLREEVEQHLRVEEEVLFTWARRIGSEQELDSMGEQMAELRHWLGQGERLSGM